MRAHTNNQNKAANTNNNKTSSHLTFTLNLASFLKMYLVIASTAFVETQCKLASFRLTERCADNRFDSIFACGLPCIRQYLRFSIIIIFIFIFLFIDCQRDIVFVLVALS